MSTLKLNSAQIGQSATATNNFTWYQPASPDGTVRLGVGNAGATSADVLTVTSAGLVGIGVSTPNRILQLSQSVNSLSAIQHTNDNAGTGAQTQIRLNNATHAAVLSHTGVNFTDTGTYGRTDSTYLYTNGANGLSLWVDSAAPMYFATGGSERMRIDTAGRLLIGTTAYTASSATMLEVYSAGSGATFLVNNSNTYSPLYVKNAYSTAGTEVPFVLFQDSSANRAGIYMNTSTAMLSISGQGGTRFLVGGSAPAPTEAMRIDSSGRTLIGTTSLYGNEKVSIYTDGNNNDYGLFVRNMSGSGYNGIRSMIAGAGNNTSTYHFQGTTNGVSNWYLYGNGTTSYSSDERQKKNIETARNGYIDDVMKLRVVKYNWLNQEDDTPKELGLIAQEVEQVFPGLVQEHELDGVEGTRKVIKHSVMEFILIKAIQEQQEQINQLKAEVAALKGN